jgi:hypothetical protein
MPMLTIQQNMIGVGQGSALPSASNWYEFVQFESSIHLKENITVYL